MIIRRPKIDELEALRKLHEPFKDQFKFPDLNLISSIYVIISEDELIGFGAIQPIFEAIIVLDQSKSIDERVMALDMLESRAELELKTQGIKQLHVFVQNNKFGNMLTNRFGYKPIKGKGLVKNV